MEVLPHARPIAERKERVPEVDADVDGQLGRLPGLGETAEGPERLLQVDDGLAVGCPRQLGSRDEFVGLSHGPTELPQGGLETMASLRSPPLYSSKRVMGLPPLPFTTVEDDPYIAPAPKLLEQLLVSVQTGAAYDKDEHV